MKRVVLVLLAFGVLFFMLAGCGGGGGGTGSSGGGGGGGGGGGSGGGGIFFTATIYRGSSVITLNVIEISATIGEEEIVIMGLEARGGITITFGRISSTPVTLTIGNPTYVDALGVVNLPKSQTTIEEFTTYKPGTGGSLTITSLTADKVSGEFNFTAASDSGETVKAEGKFSFPLGTWVYYGGSWHEVTSGA